MTVIVINPNSTVSMTQAMLEQARRSAPGLRFEGWTSHDGPPAIQGAGDGKAAAAPLLKLVSKASDANADGIIIGCFDDTALEEAANLADCPVIGIGQAAYHYAALRNWRFSVVTTLSASVPVIEANIERQGMLPFAAKVRASGVPVLALEQEPTHAALAIKEEALLAQQGDDIDAVILGCAGMVQVVEMVRESLAIETIDPVACAAKCLKWMV
ncbi:aspartate/glutamate racemase family protein [Tropicimonas sp. S265A]|uniref:aspartate/glutamate racemase family protein n=1 Tax=Tropicimonas sp. S265A TaxID=3415134 RepID=UPI003C7ED031